LDCLAAGDMDLVSADDFDEFEADFTCGLDFSDYLGVF